MWKSFIAFRYFRSKKNNKFSNFANNISLFIQITTTAILILIFSILKGYQNKIIENIIEKNGHIIISKNKAFNPISIQKTLKLKHFQVIETTAIIFDNFLYPTIILASSNNNFQQKTEHIPIIINNYLAEIFDYKKGDIIKIIIPIANSQRITQKILICEIIEIKTFKDDYLGIEINLNHFQKELDLENKIHEIRCYCDNLNLINDEINQLKKILPNYKITNWEEINAITLKMLNMEKNIVKIILFLLLFLDFLIMLLAIGLFIYSKKKEIAILKLLKAKTKDIISIFIQYILIFSSFTIIIGVPIGLILSANINSIITFLEYIFKITIFNKEIYIFNYIPTHIDKFNVYSVIAINLIGSLLNTIILTYKIFNNTTE